MDYDDDPTDGRFHARQRRRPRGRARVDALREGGDDDPLAPLRRRGWVEEIVAELKSGKEADVVVADGSAGRIVLKIHRDAAAGGFRPDPVYLDGRRVPRGRLRKVLDRGARSGLEPELALWVLHETLMLHTLAGGGVPVPEPLLGPGAHEILEAGRVVPMRFVGEEDGTPAPRLSDAELGPGDAADAWRQTLDATAKMLTLGVVHGDLSAWNLLWHEGRIVVIDVPQAVEVSASPHAALLFSRDVRSLAGSVKHLGIEVDPERLEAELRGRAGLPPHGPFPR